MLSAFPAPLGAAWMTRPLLAALAPVLGMSGGGDRPLPGRASAQEGQGCFSHLFTTCLTSASK